MKKKIFLILCSMLASASYADQSATITCTNENVIVTSKSPYWGEESSATQTLWVLKDLENREESTGTAYFLDDVEEKNNVDGYANIINGKNNKGGNFVLKIGVWKDAGDGTLIDEYAEGTITYKHGWLAGENESVKCKKE